MCRDEKLFLSAAFEGCCQVTVLFLTPAGDEIYMTNVCPWARRPSEPPLHRVTWISPLVIDDDEMQISGPVSVRGQRSIIMSAAASPAGLSDDFTRAPLSFWLSLSPPGVSVARHSAMMGFSDGIKMSRPTAVTHANCIVYRVYRCKTVSNLFCLMPLFPFFPFMVMSLSEALLHLPVNASDMSSFNLPLSRLFSVCLQVYRHSYMASYSIYNIHTR